MSDTHRDALAVLIGHAMGYARATEHTRHIAAYLIANRDAVLRALGAKPVYTSQDWIDAGGVHAGWRTGYGYFTHSREDAEKHLEWDQGTYPDDEFRLARAWLTDWEGVPDESL